MALKDFHDKFLHKMVENTNPYLGGLRRRWGNVSSDFSIISNNCWAGSVYRWYSLPYLTPTAGIYFFADDYIRFLSNIRYYLSIPPEQIPFEQSKHKDLLIERNQIDVPIGRIDDVEIVFLHYPTFDTAKEKWQRRVSRINWDNLIVKNSEMNGCTENEIRLFDKLPFERKFIFTTRDYSISSQVIFKEYLGQDQVKDDTLLFNKYINLNNLITKKPFTRRQ